MSSGGGFTRGCLATVVLTLAVFSRLDLASAVTITKDAVIVDTAPAQTSNVIGKLDDLPRRQLDFTILDLKNKPVRFQATTGADGRLPLSVVPWSEWSPATASQDGALRVPDGTFGSVEVLRSPPGAQYGSDARSGVVNTVTRGDLGNGVNRAQFGVYQGKVLQPQRYITELLSPFSNLCRSHEGPPRELATGGRFSYAVRDEPTLRLVLGQSYVKQPHYFRLPEGGYLLTSAAGAGGTQYRSGLEGLLREGRIAQLELDPCWKFLPEGASGTAACVSGELGWPEKAVRVANSFGGTLLDPFTAAPVRDGFVLYGPLSPTPFFDPGDRPGDAQPPTWTPIGADGQYRVPVQQWNGPFETTVATGCDEHSTVAIAENADGAKTTGGASVGSGTTTRGTGSGSSAPGTETRGGATPGTVARDPPGSAPSATSASVPRKPSPDQRICGPDITDYVFSVLRMIERTYDKWTSAEQADRCANLFDLTQFNAAWDMDNFAPQDGENFMTYKWFQRAAPDYCAVPEPCHKTAKFLGHCLDVQVVNYVQWGLMNYLCDTELKAAVAFGARSLFSENALGQFAMSTLGETYGNFKGFSDRADSMPRMLEDIIASDRAKWDKNIEKNCAMVCEEIWPQAKDWLDSAGWGFKWGFNTPHFIERGSELVKK